MVEESVTQIKDIVSLRNQITRDGEIDEQDVVLLRNFFINADGTYNINKESAELLFELKMLPSCKNKIADSFNVLFIDAICAFLLGDKQTTGVLDDEEIKWLKNKLTANSYIDDVIILLLEKLKRESINYPGDFDLLQIKHCLSNIRKIIIDKGKDADIATFTKKLSSLRREYNKCIADRECVGILFLIKDLVETKSVSQIDEFTRVFLDYVSDALLKDVNSPGEIDEEEANWLKSKIECRAVVDNFDNALLEQLKKKSINFPESLAKILFEKKAKEVRISVVKNGEISKEDVEVIENFLDENYDDYSCAEKEKAELLFDLKYLTISNPIEKRNDSFKDVFINAVCSYILDEKSKSPGEIDTEDEEWLNNKLALSEAKNDPYDEDTLKRLKKRSLNFPQSLDLRLSRMILNRVLNELAGRKKKIHEEIKDIEEAFYDSNSCLKIDNREASDYLFKIKDILYDPDKLPRRIQKHVKWVNSPQYSEEFSKLCIKTISSYLLEDSRSPGEIDKKEAKWLLARMQKKGGIDDYDINILKALKKRSINYPELLVNKSQWIKTGESLLYTTRLISLIAVLTSIVSSFFLFIKGVALVGYAVADFFAIINIKKIIPSKIVEMMKQFIGDGGTKDPFLNIVESVDTFLVALVLLIFSIGIYELFIGKLDPRLGIYDKRPSWMKISSIDDLKSSLVKVILIAMIVGFYKETLTTIDNPKDLMYKAIGIVLISATFGIAEISKHYQKEKQSKGK